MTARFHDKVALVTGGGTGIGQATARAFARDGATVVVAGRTEDRLAETVKLIDEDGGTAHAIAADITDDDDIARLIGEIVERFGKLDIAVNNAAIFGAPIRLADLDDDTWASVLATNVTGVWRSMKHQIAHMEARGEGTIINISSTLGAHVTEPTTGAYAASKAAVTALTQTAAKEHAATGIRINAVSPGPVDAPMSLEEGETVDERNARFAAIMPTARIATADEVAAAVIWLVSPDASFIVGHDLVVDGAQTH